MAIIDTKALFSDLTTNIITFAKASFADFAHAAEQDGQNLLNTIKDRLTRWTELLAEGRLTAEDFALLMQAQKDLVEMTALQKAGLTAIRLEQFRNGLINIILDTVSKAIPTNII